MVSSLVNWLLRLMKSCKEVTLITAIDSAIASDTPFLQLQRKVMHRSHFGSRGRWKPPRGGQTGQPPRYPTKPWRCCAFPCCCCLVQLSHWASRMMKDSCLDHQCSKGWVSKMDAVTKEGNTDDECCDRTCALYTCPEEYALNRQNKKRIAEDEDTCCLPLCKRYTCDGGYEADPQQQNKTYIPGKTDATCCIRGEEPEPEPRDEPEPEPRDATAEGNRSSTERVHEGSAKPKRRRILPRARLIDDMSRWNVKRLGWHMRMFFHSDITRPCIWAARFFHGNPAAPWCRWEHHLETGQYKNSPNAWKLTSQTAPWDPIAAKRREETKCIV